MTLWDLVCSPSFLSDVCFTRVLSSLSGFDERTFGCHGNKSNRGIRKQCTSRINDMQLVVELTLHGFICNEPFQLQLSTLGFFFSFLVLMLSITYNRTISSVIKICWFITILNLFCHRNSPKLTTFSHGYTYSSNPWFIKSVIAKIYYVSD